jgi:hypothetical protein
VTTDTYNMWNLVLQALIWVAMIATFIVYWRQLKAMQHGATGQNILPLVNYLQAENVREARTTVRKNLKGKSFNSWTDDEKLKASLVCSSYDAASLLIFRQKLVPSDPFIRNWGPSIKDCYEICRPFIDEMQKPENSGPAYWSDSLVLYREAVKSSAA